MRAAQNLSMRAAQPFLLRATPQAAIRSSAPRRMPQDMPPEGGYDPVQYKRNLPARGLRPIWYMVGIGLFMTYGWVKLYIGVREWKCVTPVLSQPWTDAAEAHERMIMANHTTMHNSELGREKMWARIHLIPMLQAEEDRDQVRRYYANQEREKDLLGHVSSVYHSDRFVRPSFSVAPPPHKD